MLTPAEIVRDAKDTEEFGYPTRALAKVPKVYQGGLARYITLGVPPGHGLRAVLENDLFTAIGHIDDPTSIAPIVRFLYNDVVGGCYGSKERVSAWIARGGHKKTAP